VNPKAHCWTFGHSVNGIQRTYQREFPHKLPAKFLKNSCGAGPQQSTAERAAERAGKYSPAGFPVNISSQRNVRSGPAAREPRGLEAEGAHYRWRKGAVNELSRIYSYVRKHLKPLLFFQRHSSEAARTELQNVDLTNI